MASRPAALARLARSNLPAVAVLGLNAHTEFFLVESQCDLAWEARLELGGVSRLHSSYAALLQSTAGRLPDSPRGETTAGPWPKPCPTSGTAPSKLAREGRSRCPRDLRELANAHDVPPAAQGHLGLGLLDETVMRDAALRALEISGSSSPSNPQRNRKQNKQTSRCTPFFWRCDADPSFPLWDGARYISIMTKCCLIASIEIDSQSTHDLHSKFDAENSDASCVLSVRI